MSVAGWFEKRKEERRERERHFALVNPAFAALGGAMPAPLAEPAICSFCGATMPAGTRFCAACGATRDRTWETTTQGSLRPRPRSGNNVESRGAMKAMKTLLILRHAKAQPDAPAGDHARALTTRGRRNATAIGGHLDDTSGRPDAIVTSDAQRALQTAELVAEATDFTSALTLEPRLYGAGLDTLVQVVRSLPDEAGSALLVGHNPGLEELVAALAPTEDPVALPTAALAQIELDVARWSEVELGTGRLSEVITPKMLD